MTTGILRRARPPAHQPQPCKSVPRAGDDQSPASPWACRMRPDWWCYPERCQNGHEWAPGLITVSWVLCDCPPAQTARERAGARPGIWRCSATRRRAAGRCGTGRGVSGAPEGLPAGGLGAKGQDGRLSGPRGVRGQRKRGPRPPGAWCGGHESPPGRQPAGGRVQAGLGYRCLPRTGVGTLDGHARRPRLVRNRGQKITPRCRHE